MRTSVTKKERNSAYHRVHAEGGGDAAARIGERTGLCVTNGRIGRECRILVQRGGKKGIVGKEGITGEWCLFLLGKHVNRTGRQQEEGIFEEKGEQGRGRGPDPRQTKNIHPTKRGEI